MLTFRTSNGDLIEVPEEATIERTVDGKKETVSAEALRNDSCLKPYYEKQMGQLAEQRKEVETYVKMQELSEKAAAGDDEAFVELGQMRGMEEADARQALVAYRNMQQGSLPASQTPQNPEFVVPDDPEIQKWIPEDPQAPVIIPDNIDEVSDEVVDALDAAIQAGRTYQAEEELPDDQRPSGPPTSSPNPKNTPQKDSSNTNPTSPFDGGSTSEGDDEMDPQTKQEVEQLKAWAVQQANNQGRQLLQKLVDSHQKMGTLNSAQKEHVTDLLQGAVESRLANGQDFGEATLQAALSEVEGKVEQLGFQPQTQDATDEGRKALREEVLASLGPADDSGVASAVQAGEPPKRVSMEDPNYSKVLAARVASGEYSGDSQD